MQRRAAAVYFALFVLIAAGAYTFLQVGMAQPAADFDADTYSQGDQLSAGGTTYTVATVEASESEGETTFSAELTWQNETGANMSMSFAEGDNVTLSGVQHVAHFPSDSAVYVLPHDQYLDEYQEFTDTQDHFGERKAGFWGVIYISLLGGLILLMSAYLPVKG